MAALFRHYVIVDWSAASQPKRGRDSIWICHRGPRGERCDNPATRHAAKAQLGDLLAEIRAEGGRALVGFDFPFGYPAGFAKRLGLAGLPWQATWGEIVRLMRDGDKNENNRFEVAAILNQRVSNGSFPFWGCPPSKARQFLGSKHHGVEEPDGLRNNRLIDDRMVGAQPCWKLLGAGSVGGQVLTGIPVVHALRNDERLREHCRIWPFETGLREPGNAQVVFAEVWPSWWEEWKAARRPGEVNDQAQVRTVAEVFAARDRAGGLGAWFAGDPDLTGEQRRVVETEEAWTLGVTAPKQKSPSPSHNAAASHDTTRHSGAQPRAANPEPIFQRSGLMGSGPAALRRPGMTSLHTRAGAGEGEGSGFTYLRDPVRIYRRSFALVRAEADLARFPVALRPLAARLAHAAGDASILDDLLWSRGAVVAGRRALASGAAVLADSAMTAAGIAAERLPAGNPVICTLRDPAAAALAAAQKTTRSAAAVELWRPHLAGAVVAIGNAPTALFHLLEMLAAGADRPALVLGFPVGFVGAAEAKKALTRFGRGLAYVTLAGRRGGSALAAAAVNALGRRARP